MVTILSYKVIKMGLTKPLLNKQITSALLIPFAHSSSVLRMTLFALCDVIRTLTSAEHLQNFVQLPLVYGEKCLHFRNL